MIIKGKTRSAENVLRSLVELSPNDFEQIDKTDGTFLELVEAIKKSDSFISDDLKPVCLAQWILESGHGTSDLFKKHYNAGGLKWRDEMETYADSVDYHAHDGKDRYCKFANFQSFIIGYWKFIDRNVYAGWDECAVNKGIATPEKYITFLAEKGYSTDPDYADKVIKLIPKAEIYLAEIYEKGQEDNIWIFLDPGHSKKSPGAISKNGTVKEYDLNLRQAKRIKEILEQQEIMKFKVDIVDPDLDDLELIGMATNKRRYQMSIHLHHNSYSGDSDPGTETLYDDDKCQQESKQLAKLFSAAISTALGTRNRGAKQFRGIVLDIAERQGDFPVVLTESYFINPYNKSEAEKRSDIAAEAIAKTIINWFIDGRNQWVSQI